MSRTPLEPLEPLEPRTRSLSGCPHGHDLIQQCYIKYPLKKSACVCLLALILSSFCINLPIENSSQSISKYFDPFGRTFSLWISILKGWFCCEKYRPKHNTTSEPFHCLEPGCRHCWNSNSSFFLWKFAKKNKCNNFTLLSSHCH